MQKISVKAANLIGSEIIKLGNEINRKVLEGESIYNLTIGDFDPHLFSIPEVLEKHIIEAYQAKQTDYPPGDGTMALKQAVRSFIFNYEHLDYNEDELMIASGGRPLIYATYQAIVDPGDKVLYPVPSWNNNHYCHLSDAQRIEVHTKSEDGFMPNAEELKPYLSDVVLLALCSPLNPTGTTFKKEQLEQICDLVLEENKRREGKEKPLYVLFDQIYWLLRMEGVEHYNPVSLRPEMKPYTIFVDGITKSLAATGVRVGWGLGPAEVISKMKSIIGHIGAWAPKPEQVGTAKFLSNENDLNCFLNEMRSKINLRLTGLFEGFEKLKSTGYPVQIIKPEGAIYLSVQFALIGKKTREGREIKTTSDINNFLLNHAKFAGVPFTAFGCADGTDWYRISVGTLNDKDIPDLFSKLRKALDLLN